jgi:hypothetical protein
MPLYELSTTKISDLERVDFSSVGVREREDLQRLIDSMEASLDGLKARFGDYGFSLTRTD